MQGPLQQVRQQLHARGQLWLSKSVFESQVWPQIRFAASEVNCGLKASSKPRSLPCLCPINDSLVLLHFLRRPPRACRPWPGSGPGCPAWPATWRGGEGADCRRHAWPPSPSAAQSPDIPANYFCTLTSCQTRIP